MIYLGHFSFQHILKYTPLLNTPGNVVRKRKTPLDKEVRSVRILRGTWDSLVIAKYRKKYIRKRLESYEGYIHYTLG